MTVQAGDFVRCTSEDDVLIGMVIESNDRALRVAVSKAAPGDCALTLGLDRWQVEVIPVIPPEPPVGSVVITGIGRAWQRAECSGWQAVTATGSVVTMSWEDLARRPLTLLRHPADVLQDIRMLDPGDECSDGWNDFVVRRLAEKYGIEA